jgi:anti-sigma factor RsiW
MKPWILVKTWVLRWMHGALLCSQVDARLDDYREDRLDPIERKRFERHMRFCRPCRDYLEAYGKTVALTRALAQSADEAEVRLPASISEAILSAQRTERK